MEFWVQWNARRSRDFKMPKDPKKSWSLLRLIYSNGWSRVYPKQMASSALTPGPAKVIILPRTKAKATDLSRLIQISVDAQFEHRESAPILDLIRGWEGGGNGFFIGNI